MRSGPVSVKPASTPRLLQIVGVAMVYCLLVLSGLALILGNQMDRQSVPENIAPALSNVRIHYAQTMSDLAIHTNRFTPASAKRAKQKYAELHQAVLLVRDRVRQEQELSLTVRRPLIALMSDIVAAEPAVARIDISLIDAGQAFGALYGMEEELRALTIDLDAFYQRQLDRAVAREQQFSLHLIVLVTGSILYSGIVVAMLWVSMSRLRQSYAHLERAAAEVTMEKARAETASAAKSRFLATMSHEMRTPMNGVIGLSQLLLLGKLDDRQREFAERIYQSGTSLVELINEVLDTSAIEAGTLRIEPKDFFLAGLLDSAKGPFEAVALSKGLSLKVEFHADLSPAWHGDDQRIRQILQNLIGNAVKFTPEGGISLTADIPPEGGLRFRVRDTGTGISPDQLPLIFDRFHQVDNTETRKHGGTGLGLAISRELAELMGGSLSAESEVGEGSCFTLTLPIRPVMEMPDQQDRAALAADTDADTVDKAG